MLWPPRAVNHWAAVSALVEDPDVLQACTIDTTLSLLLQSNHYCVVAYLSFVYTLSIVIGLLFSLLHLQV